MLKNFRNNQEGFLLVDSIFAVVVLLIALVAIGSMFIQAQNANIVAKQITIASNLGQEALEYYKSKDSTFWQNASRDMAPPNPSMSVAGMTYTVSAPTETVSPYDLSGRLIQLRIPVQWESNTVYFDTYVLKSLPQYP